MIDSELIAAILEEIEKLDKEENYPKSIDILIDI